MAGWGDAPSVGAEASLGGLDSYDGDVAGEIGSSPNVMSSWQGFQDSLTGRGLDPAMVVKSTPYARGQQTGHALSLMAGVLTLAMGGLRGPASTGKSAYALGQWSGGTRGGGAPAVGPDPGDVYGAAQTLGLSREETEQVTAPGPRVTPYEQTKDYLGGQERMRTLQGEIERLGTELEDIRKRRAALLEPKRRKMVGRIPLVHTETGREGETKTLTPQKRQRMLMSHGAR